MKVATLEEISTFVSKGTTPMTLGHAFRSTGIPFLRAEDVIGASVNPNTVAFRISEETNRLLSRSQLQPGDLLITIAGTLGRVGYVPKSAPPMNCNQAVAFVRLRPEVIDLNYASLACQAKIGHLLQLQKIGTIGNLNLEQVRGFSIPLPPLDEQKRIAARLEKADRLRRTRRYVHEISDTFLQAHFLEMFGDAGARASSSQMVTVEDLCDVIVDCPHYTPKTFARRRTCFPFIRTSDIQEGYFDWSTTKYVDLDEYTKRIARHRPVQGDVIYTREGERYGLAVRVPSGLTPCLGQRVMLLQPRAKTTTTEYLWALLSSPIVYKQALQLVGGSTSPHVNVGDIKAFKVFFPPLKSQQQFSKLVVNYDRLRRQRLEADRQAEHLFQTLLHRTFAEIA